MERGPVATCITRARLCTVDMIYKILLVITLLFVPTTMSPESGRVKIVYSYNTTDIDSLNIKVLKNYKIIYDVNRKSYFEFDSIQFNTPISPDDTIHIYIKGYKGTLYCFPFIDTFINTTDISVSYGINFGCTKLRS
jgi:hypothetical protein